MVASSETLKETLPSRFYYDPAHYQRELDTFWYRHWIYACRAEELSEAGAFRLISIGTQSLLVVRDTEGRLHAFHNTCRHRGSILCSESEGRFERGRIVCPYHRWTYTLAGDLAGVSLLDQGAGVPFQDLSLYTVKLRCWGGFIFVNLSTRPVELETAMDPAPQHLANWPLESLVTAHTFNRRIGCNWKVFWENFVECYHCPGIHPELCDLVPLYRRGLTDDTLDPKASSRLRAGAESWSMDGSAMTNRFENLSAEQLEAGQTFLTVLPSIFIVAHRDYVRAVSILPDGPENVQLQARWLFPPESIVEGMNLSNVVDFATLVLDQDARVCELNQQGLRSIRHEKGYVTPLERDVHAFQDWVRAELTSTSA